MSLHTLTIDQLMQLDQKTLTYALRIFQHELDGTLALLAETPESRTDAQVLDDLSNLLTLRKVFTLRLAELAELAGESASQPALAFAQPALAAA